MSDWKQVYNSTDGGGLPRAPQWFLSGVAGHADPEDIVGPVEGDTFLYPASGDLFYYDGDSWDYSSTIGGA